MKALVIYDSKYGNTEKVAKAIGAGIDAQVSMIGDVSSSDLKGFDLVIIGSPTHGGFPTEGVHILIKTSPSFEGVNAAAFDTRTKTTIFGYAAPKMAKNLSKNGAKLLTPPEGFFVLGTEGPLMEGEIERAVDWAKRIASR